jgi:tetratricopeptide (TPR) repeat protein
MTQTTLQHGWMLLLLGGVLMMQSVYAQADELIFIDGERASGVLLQSTDMGFFLQRTDGSQEYYLWDEVEDIVQTTELHVERAAGMPSGPPAPRVTRLIPPTASNIPLPLTVPVLPPERLPVVAVGSEELSALPADATVVRETTVSRRHVWATQRAIDMAALYQRGAYYLERYHAERTWFTIDAASLYLARAWQRDRTYGATHALLAEIAIARQITQQPAAQESLRAVAVEHIAHALDRAPNDVVVQQAAARVYTALGQWATVERHVQQAVILAPEHPRTRLLVADQARRQGDYTGALNTYQLIDELLPAEALLRSVLADRIAEVYAIDMTDPAQAIPWRERSIRRYPTSPTWLHRYGLDLERAGRLQDAVQVLEQAGTQVGLEHVLHQDLARVYLRGEQLVEAAALFRALQNGEGLRTVAHIYAEQGRKTMAETIMRQVLQLNPQDAEAAYMIGIYALDQEDWMAAKQAFQQTTAIDPSNADAYYGLGYVSEQLQESEDATAYYQYALAQEPIHVKALKALGSLFYDRGQYVEAAPLLQQRFALTPADAWVAYAAGHALSRIGQRGQAATYFKHYLKLMPDGTMAEPIHQWFTRYAHDETAAE